LQINLFKQDRAGYHKHASLTIASCCPIVIMIRQSYHQMKRKAFLRSDTCLTWRISFIYSGFPSWT